MELKWSLFTKDIRPHPQLRVKLQQKIHKLEEHLQDFPPDDLNLKVSLEKHQKKKWFRVALALKLPTGILRIKKFGDDPLSIADQAVKAMLRELTKTKEPVIAEKSQAAAAVQAPGESLPAASIKPVPPLATSAPAAAA